MKEIIAKDIFLSETSEASRPLNDLCECLEYLSMPWLLSIELETFSELDRKFFCRITRVFFTSVAFQKFLLRIARSLVDKAINHKEPLRKLEKSLTTNQ